MTEIIKTYYENGSLYSEIPNTKIGIMVHKYYYKNGNIKSEIEYDYDEEMITGVTKYYYKSGVLQNESLFDNDLNEFIKKDYYESGTLKYITPSKVEGENIDDVFFVSDGLQKKYYESGALKKETFYVWDEKHGVQKYYYDNTENQILKAEFPYVKDKIHGIVKEYYESGNLFTETTYENGEEIGESKIYLDSDENIQIA